MHSRTGAGRDVLQPLFLLPARREEKKKSYGFVSSADISQDSLGIQVPIVMKNNIIPLLSKVAGLFTPSGEQLPGKELLFNGASFTMHMKDGQGRDQDKTRFIPTLNNGY